MKVKARYAIPVLGLVGIVAAGIAWASWTASGSGSASAKADTSAPVTVVGATSDGDLYPGGTGNLKMTVTNENDFAVTITGVTADGAVTADDEGCNAETVAFADQDELDLSVEANGSQVITLPDSVSMASAANDDCQGASFDIPVEVQAVSS